MQAGEFLFAQLDLWRSNANCNQQQQSDLDLIDLMALMEDNADSFQQQPTRNVMDPPPAYPGTPEVKHNPDDFFVEDEGTFTSYICSNITGSFCIFTAAQSNELLAKELI